ncbi:hypothetical protein [Virgibacillus sp. DJP39]|uniref:hypothetical protein n=1 Tax=Virgibacillus sp. DJP39 TaxID=3409790 RepID=UPI003BB7CF54
MVENNSEYNDQANELRKLINEVQDNKSSETPKEDNATVSGNLTYDLESTSFEENENSRTADILNLPPRKEIHSNQNHSIKLKVSRPLLRISAVILTLVIVLLGVYYVWGNDLIKLPSRF